MPPNCLTCSPPRPLRPATPIRIVSLAPSTLPDDLVPAMVIVAAAARVPFKKLRRFSNDMRVPHLSEARVGLAARTAIPAQSVPEKPPARQQQNHGSRDHERDEPRVEHLDHRFR